MRGWVAVAALSHLVVLICPIKVHIISIRAWYHLNRETCCRFSRLVKDIHIFDANKCKEPHVTAKSQRIALRVVQRMHPIPWGACSEGWFNRRREDHFGASWEYPDLGKRGVRWKRIRAHYRSRSHNHLPSWRGPRVSHFDIDAWPRARFHVSNPSSFNPDISAQFSLTSALGASDRPDRRTPKTYSRCGQNNRKNGSEGCTIGIKRRALAQQCDPESYRVLSFFVWVAYFVFLWVIGAILICRSISPG